MDLTLIAVALLGLLGTVLSAYLSNRNNFKNQKEILKLELEKQKINSETELNIIKIQNKFEIESKLIDYEFKQKSEIFANYSYCASRLKYSGKFYRTEHYEYLKAYNEACTAISSNTVFQEIQEFHKYLNTTRSNSLVYDEKFENHLNLINDLFSNEIRSYKSQLRNTEAQK